MKESVITMEMATLYDLRAISEGYDIDDVEIYGGEELLTEAFEGHKAKKALKSSKAMKAAKNEIKLARKMAKTDPQAGLKHFDNAIKALKDLRKEAEQIPDDHIAEALTLAFVRFFVTNTLIGLIGVGAIVGYSVKSAQTISGMIQFISNLDKIKKAANVFGTVNGIISSIIGFAKIDNYTTAVKLGTSTAKQPETSNEKWKMGVSRADMIARIDRLIKISEDGRSKYAELAKLAADAKKK